MNGHNADELALRGDLRAVALSALGAVFDYFQKRGEISSRRFPVRESERLETHQIGVTSLAAVEKEHLFGIARRVVNAADERGDRQFESERSESGEVENEL